VKALALLIALQSTETIPRAHKDAYVKAVDAGKKAAELIESEPAQALQLMDSVLEDPKVKKRECRLRIELTPGTYSPLYDFFPFQLRGRVHLKLSEKGDRAAQARHLQNAVDDFDQSVKLGLESSRPLLEAARQRLEALRAESSGDEREVKLRRDWQAHLDAGRFVDAKKHVQAEGGFLSAERRKTLLDETDRLSRETAERAAARFLLNLTGVRTVEDAAALEPEDFERSFSLPDPAALTASSPRLEWCARVRETLREFRDGLLKLDALFRAAVDSLALAKDGENRWFQAVEGLAFDVVRAHIAGRAAAARDAAEDERRRLATDADASAQQWRSFERRVRAAAADKPEFVKKLPARDLAKPLAQFPRDAEGVAEFPRKFRACFDADDPAAAFEGLAEELARAEKEWDRLTIESRRALLTFRILAAAHHGLLLGRTPEEIAAGLDDSRPGLKQVGAGAEAGRFGPKVADVFARLK